MQERSIRMSKQSFEDGVPKLRLNAVKDFRNRFDSAKSLSARVTHRGSHLPGVTLK